MTIDVMAQLSIGQQFADVAASGPLMLGIFAAAAAGLISFASPCVVPLVPGYMSYLASVVGGEVEYDSEHGAVVTKKRQWAVAGAAGDGAPVHLHRVGLEVCRLLHGDLLCCAAPHSAQPL